MGERPMTDAEKARLRERLGEARKELGPFDSYVARMEDDLQRGTVWMYDPGAFKKMCAEVKEVACKDREMCEEREIAEYGHVLTREERLGWVSPASVESRVEEVKPDEGGTGK